MAKPMGIALHSLILGTPSTPWVPMEGPSSPSPHLPLHVGVSGRPHPGAGWLETGFQVAPHPGEGHQTFDQSSIFFFYVLF